MSPIFLTIFLTLLTTSCKEEEAPTVFDDWSLDYEKKLCEPVSGDVFNADQLCLNISFFQLSIDTDRHGFFEFEGNYEYLFAGGNLGQLDAAGDLVANPNGGKNGYTIEMDGDQIYLEQLSDFEMVLECEIITEGKELKCVADDLERYTFTRENNPQK